MKIINQEKIKQQFQIFKRRPNLHYLDSAATALTPDVVVEAMNEYYFDFKANIGRGQYKTALLSESAYEAARHKVANFIGADKDEVVFTSGATAGLNLLALAFGKKFQKGDNIVLSSTEHHSNFAPWIKVADEAGVEVRFLPLRNNDSGFPEIDYEQSEEIIDHNTVLIAVSLVGNAFGNLTDIDFFVAKKRAKKALLVIDACQAASHLPISVRELNADFLVFSGHKCYGPTGVGVLYMKKELSDIFDGFFWGGGMIEDFTADFSPMRRESPFGFEAGTPPIAEVIGLGRAIDFINEIGFTNIADHEKKLEDLLIKKLKDFGGVSIYLPENLSFKATGIVSFNLDGIHPHDLAEILSRHEVAVRSGLHCARPLFSKLNLPYGTLRVSFAAYSTEEDILALISAVDEARQIFKNKSD